jgi:hypothetical protein
LVESLIATLAENEILSADQTNRLFQVASQSLAKFPQPDPGVKNARVLVNGIATLVAEHLQRQPK